MLLSLLLLLLSSSSWLLFELYLATGAYAPGTWPPTCQTGLR